MFAGPLRLCSVCLLLISLHCAFAQPYPPPDREAATTDPYEDVYFSSPGEKVSNLFPDVRVDRTDRKNTSAPAVDSDYPYYGVLPLEKRALLIEEGIEKGNMSNGLPMPRVLLPPDGNADNSTASQEDGTSLAGPAMAAYVYRYKVTGDPVARDRAVRTAHTLEMLERVTGVDGLIARSYNFTDKVQPHEQWFFFPMEWHWSSRFKNTRWLGDPSSDALTRFLYGNALYFDLVADSSEKARVKALVDRVVSRFVDHNFKIVDSDGKMTLWGNYSPDLPHQPLNALLCLAALKIASHITEDAKFEDAYWKLIHEHGYHEETIIGDSTMNCDPPVPWDHDLGLLGLFHLMTYETDPWLLGFYRASLERFHDYDLSRDVRIPYYDFIYKVLTNDHTPADPETLEGFFLWDHAWKQFVVERVRQEDGRKIAQGIWQECGETFPKMYWMGRYYGFIDADTGNEPPKAAPPKDPPPEMVLVPVGEFIMGSEVGDEDERPVRHVSLPAFYIDRCEVSNAEFKLFKPNYVFPKGKEDCAASSITWEEARDYAAFVGKRLPTEAEWEKAARGTDGRMFPWGNQWLTGMVPAYDRGPVDSQAQAVSPFGCLQMAGNVWEWVADWYHPYPGNSIPSPAYGEKYKVIRGGADFNDASRLRTSCRYYCDPKTRVSGLVIGLRCAKDAR
jgi:iron(II)-dependent oxidoreductase